ncbi:MAG: nuclear transport factor 2 family protein [Thermoleophilaceae bacterium]|nr:nuclear transport factor 2 family protein [Thermoleophilaceae bacterium]
MDTVHAFYDLYNRGDLDAAIELFTPDARLENRVLGQTYEGVAAIRGFWDEFAEIVEDAQAVPKALSTDGDLVLVDIELRGRMRHTGFTEETMSAYEVVHGLRVENDKVAWWAICSTHAEVLRAAGRHE